MEASERAVLWEFLDLSQMAAGQENQGGVRVKAGRNSGKKLGEPAMGCDGMRWDAMQCDDAIDLRRLK